MLRYLSFLICTWTVVRGVRTKHVEAHADILNDTNSKQIWTHWDLNPGPSACEADVIPLHHEPNMHRGVLDWNGAFVAVTAVST